MVAEAAAAEQFRIGRVIERTFAVLGRNFVPFIVLSTIAQLPFLASQFVILSVYGPMPATPNLANLLARGAGNFIAGLIGLAFVFALQAALSQGTFAELSGKRASLGDCFATGLREFLPLAVIAFLTYLGFILGLVLLVVPGIMIAIAWAVVAPVRVVEHTSIFATFGRSAQLTRGHRWAIFGLVVIYVILGGIAAYSLSPLAGGGLIPAPSMVSSPVYLLEQGVLRVFTAVILGTGTACIYYELRSIKEGIGPEQLAAVFD